LSTRPWTLRIATVGALLIGSGRVLAAEPARSPQSDPVALRMESFTVPPSSRPLAFVVVKNLQAVPYEGSLAVKPPEGWRLAPSDRQLALKVGGTQRVPFTVARGLSVRSNS
jgi:hypothetical protein